MLAVADRPDSRPLNIAIWGGQTDLAQALWRVRQDRGPAGLAAGLYTARARRRTVLLEKGVIGGQISLTERVENYPGVEAIGGFDLAQTMLRQAESSGLATHPKEVVGLERLDALWVVKTNDGDYRAKAVIVTSGADFNRLEVPGEERLTGRGVSYCATCDAPFFAGQEVAVVGGGDSAWTRDVRRPARGQGLSDPPPR
jgi:thioredoxin reductase (NADPH)